MSRADAKKQTSSRGTIRDQKGRFAASWSWQEIRTLRQLRRMGAAEVAAALGRSPWAVKKQAQRLRISLRAEGQRRGLLLGQPRRVSFLEDSAMARLRAAVLAGAVNIERIVGRAEAWARGEDLCPACAIRPIENATSGFCSTCHTRRLAEGHAAG